MRTSFDRQLLLFLSCYRLIRFESSVEEQLQRSFRDRMKEQIIATLVDRVIITNHFHFSSIVVRISSK
jgi:hypothetical protein